MTQRHLSFTEIPAWTHSSVFCSESGTAEEQRLLLQAALMRHRGERRENVIHLKFHHFTLHPQPERDETVRLTQGSQLSHNEHETHISDCLHSHHTSNFSQPLTLTHMDSGFYKRENPGRPQTSIMKITLHPSPKEPRDKTMACTIHKTQVCW